MGFINFLKRKWLKSRWIAGPPLQAGELLRQNTQVKHGLVMGMRLAVLEDQAAAVVVDDRLISVFLPGAYQLEQDKMPPLPASAKHDWLFPAQLYYLNLGLEADEPWQPQHPLITRDPERGLVQLNLCGTYDAQVENATLFMQFMVLQKGFRDWPAVHTHIRGRLSDLAIQFSARQYMPLSRLERLKDKAAATIIDELNRELAGSGLVLRAVRVETLELHPGLRHLLEAQQDYHNFNQALSRAIVG